MPCEFLKLTPREVGKMAEARRKQDTRERKLQRFETAILCTYVAKSLGGNKHLTVRSVYESMKIRDEDEPAGQRYKGSFVDQIDAHIAYLKKKQDGDHS